MNVFQKLQLARVRFLEAGVDKSGKHMKLEYKYFELADIVPKAEQIFLEIGLMMVPSMYGDKATARVYNVNDRDAGDRQLHHLHSPLPVAARFGHCGA